MNAILSQIITPQMRVAGIILLLMIIAIYLLSIVWVSRDAKLRDCDSKKWTLIAIIPIIGLVSYLLLRPSMYAMDRDEQELEVALKQRQLMEYGECARCGYPVKSDYIVCPSCQTALRNLCPRCTKPLEPTWSMCPYCATKLTATTNAASRSHPTARSRRSAAKSEQAPA
jgi:RNA polymerase subunit RPABC4/transcription elongation factor Spt4